MNKINIIILVYFNNKFLVFKNIYIKYVLVNF